MTRRTVRPPRGSLGPALLLAVSIAAGFAPACARRSDDPALGALARALGPGDRLVLARVLDPDTGDRIAAVVRPSGKGPELRVYERRGRGYVVVHTARQGDEFHNLALEDVTGDGHDEILATWTGGHLEILEVIGRAADGSYTTLFQNGGQEIERRYGPGGAVEFWITSRTYAESEGKPPTYATTVYRWDGHRFVEALRR
jgi:hypothetical protein